MPLSRRLTPRTIDVGLLLLLAVALLLLAVRLVLPFDDHARERVEQSLSQRLGYQVAIGRLALTLSGWNPQLSLKRVTLSDPRTHAAVLSLREMDLGLVLSSSLKTLSPQFDALTLVGARLDARRTAEEWQLPITDLAGCGGMLVRPARIAELEVHAPRCRWHLRYLVPDAV